jgi:uncharacterized protein YcbX
MANFAQLFSVGDVDLIGISPRLRCTVQPRNPWTGEADQTFARTLSRIREATPPEGSLLRDHGSFYQLCVNVAVPPAPVGKVLRVGDPVRIRGVLQLDSV